MITGGQAIAAQTGKLFPGHGGIAYPDTVYPLTLLLADNGIAVLSNDLPESHDRPEPCHVIHCFHKFPNLGEFQACIRKHSRSLRIEGPNQMQKNGGILAAGEGNIDHAIPMFVPFPDAKLRFENLCIQREVLHLCKLP